MGDATLATDETKTALENNVNWFLSDKLVDANTPIATKKFLTNNNLLVYLTRCNVAELAVPRVKVQVLQRVKGGVHETSYQLFGDHRLEKYENDMIFGAKPSNDADGSVGTPVSDAEGQQLIQLVNSLQNAHPTL